MTITVLSDNRANPQAPGLGSEHGLSLYVDTGQGRILFDTGASDLFARNARLLGIDLAAVDAAILSHGHYDHGGGLPAFLTVNARARISVGPGAFDPHFAATVGPLRKYVGLDRPCLEQIRGRSIIVDGEAEPVAGVFVLSSVGIGDRVPPDMSRFTRRTGSALEPDDFSHEIIAVIAGEAGPGGPAGLAVLTGCSHKGILNVVAAVKDRFPGRQIKAIVGGLHMMNPATRGLAESPADIEAAGQALRDDTAVHRLYAGHCTGEKAFALLGRVMGPRIAQLAVGMRIEV
jgi:7,8-dihydropterin-6-yl-methyl-4-(beta-D-ribofuranosyl)aminobenzene 5'-phosphate synthase